MNKESNQILVDSYRAGIIDKIAKDNTTIFSDFDDFVNEAIGTYITFWTDPAQLEIHFQSLLPHMRPEQLEFMKEVMDKKEYENFTKGIGAAKSKLQSLDYFPLKNPGQQRFHLDDVRFRAIEKIIQTENVNKKLRSVKEFVDYAITLFMTFWTEPKKTEPLQYDMWPYFPTKVKEEWKNNPKFANTFKRFEKNATEWNEKQGMDLTDLTDEMKTKSVDYEIDQTIKRHEEFSMQDEKPTMQTASSEGARSFIGLCKRMDETKRFLREQMFGFVQPENDAKTTWREYGEGSVHLPYDDYPLIWEFYTRMLPMKVLVAVLADMTREESRERVNYKEFRERAYYAALGLAERLSDYEKKWKIKRNEKRSTGFPASPIDTLGKLDIEKMKKFETSKQRFQEYFIGMKMESWLKRQIAGEEGKVDRGMAFFDGALNAMGLAYVRAYNNGKEPKFHGRKNEYVYEYNKKEDFSLEIGLTGKGLEFYLKENPIFKDYEQLWWPKVFSKEESEFILKEIIPDFPLENEFVKKIMDTLAKSKTDYVKAETIDEKLDQVALKWLQNNEHHRSFKDINKCRSQEKNDKGEKIGPKIIRTWRSRTMARLAEMNKIEWIIEKKTSKPQYKIKKEPPRKLSKKKVALTSKSK